MGSGTPYNQDALEQRIAEAYKAGFAKCYSDQVIAAMSGQAPSDDRWCAVEGCQAEPDYFDLRSGEFCCEAHLGYPDIEPAQSSVPGSSQ